MKETADKKPQGVKISVLMSPELPLTKIKLNSIKFYVCRVIGILNIHLHNLWRADKKPQRVNISGMMSLNSRDFEPRCQFQYSMSAKLGVSSNWETFSTTLSAKKSQNLGKAT